MATVPNTFTIDPFDPAVCPWSRWLRRLEGAFKIFKVPDTDRVPYLLHYMGAVTFNVLTDRVTPQDPYAKTYAEITEIMQEYYEPKPLEVAENFKLWQHKQQENESILEFVAALQKLSLNCQMGDYTKTALRNFFIFGLRNKRIQSRLLEIQDLTLDKAVQTASSMELSEEGVKQFQEKEAVAAIESTARKAPRTTTTQHKDKPVKKKSSKQSGERASHSVVCFRCGRGHYASACTLQIKIKNHYSGENGYYNYKRIKIYKIF